MKVKTIKGHVCVRVSHPFDSNPNGHGWAIYDGTVLVYDSVAKHFTSVHSLTPRQRASVISRLKKA